MELSALNLIPIMAIGAVRLTTGLLGMKTGHSKSIGNFCADSGMVCVADLRSVLRFNPKYDYHIKNDWTTTLIKDFKGTVRIKIDLVDEGNEIYPAYSASVIGQGVNIKTGEPIEFYTKQTEL